jgi:hypothetical protein
VAEAKTPKWQSKVVKRYIRSQESTPRANSSWPFAPQNAVATGANYSVNCSSSDPASCINGRGFPDLVLSGVFLPVQLAGVPVAVSGTSASAPAFAWLVMHLSAAVRATPGLRDCKLGFLNPFL